MSLPRTKGSLPSSAVYIYNDSTDEYVAWDGNITLATGDLATEDTLKAVAGFVILPFDTVVLTYVASGFGIGEIQTAAYRTGGLGGTVVATLTLTYDSSNRLSSVVKT